jgi:hypothetical protein
MQNTLPTVDAPIGTLEAARALETIVTELELLTDESPLAIRADLITLHGALLAYEIGGVAKALPTIGFGMSGRRILERRVVRAAKNLIGVSDAETAVNRSASTIEELIHLIDPELRSLAA